MQTEATLKAIDHAISVLNQGGVILYPADTIWGLGCDARNKDAIHRIHEIKGRPESKSMIVLVASITQLYEVAAFVHPRIDTLLYYHERPLTVIYPAAKKVYGHLAAKDGTIAVRVVKSGFCHELLVRFGFPLISTSANLSGEPSPVRFGSISSVIINQVDFTVPAFTEKDISGKPSMIARYDENGELEFVRS